MSVPPGASDPPRAGDPSAPAGLAGGDPAPRGGAAPVPPAEPLWKNPWLWALVVGMATVTLLRPVLRHVPEAPEPGATLPAVTLEGPDGPVALPAGLAGRVHVVALVEADCPAGACTRILGDLVGVTRAWAEERAPVDVLALALGGPQAAGQVEARARALGAAAGDVRALDAGTPAACEVARVALAAVAPGRQVPCSELAELGHAARVALVDDQGQVRGVYATSDLGLDELHSRALHVVRARLLPPTAERRADAPLPGEAPRAEPAAGEAPGAGEGTGPDSSGS